MRHHFASDIGHILFHLLIDDCHQADPFNV
jgi:hypothetical protein